MVFIVSIYFQIVDLYLVYVSSHTYIFMYNKKQRTKSVCHLRV